MNLDLKNKKWKEFVIEDIFKVDKGVYLHSQKMIKGNIPFVSAKSIENGFSGFIGNPKIFDGNAITIEKIKLTAFYQPHKFYCSHDVTVIENSLLNEYNAKFICQIINRNGIKYNYGRQAQMNVVKREKILLPINTKGEPDFKFMEAFIKEKEENKTKIYNAYILNRLKKVEDFKKVAPLEDKEWEVFEIGELFTLSQGKSKGLNHLKKSKEGVNYLGATNQNNGVLCQVEKVEKLLHKGNGIAFIRNGEGSMGYSIYKTEEFIATSDISVGYNSNLNREIGLFITTVADKVRGKYNFGYKRSGNRLKKEKILLPINDQNEPDYIYMENYIKQLEYNKLKEYQKIKMN
ncbi:restriction endonuclease subunit S [Aquimarina rhabdastrellae]